MMEHQTGSVKSADHPYPTPWRPLAVTAWVWDRRHEVLVVRKPGKATQATGEEHQATTSSDAGDLEVIKALRRLRA